ncbi:hypothetical protein Zmor_019170 [Zophobas morio]|uniref:Uncharacterized protein n=1 Tax=Zophobas morio TaxID=2755281 RepID=A0AA38I162_9CUCU|nr:hypothetical protein Zmor_019170 [Zophobas morio]
MGNRIASNTVVDVELRDMFEEAISTHDLNKLKHLIKTAPGKWCQIKTYSGHTLLQEAMYQNSKDIFHYMLRFHDLEDLETVSFFKQTALMFSMKTWYEYYAYELIKKGASIYGIYRNGNNLLHRAVSVSVRMTKLLLDRGMAVNAQDRSGETPLHKVLLKGLHSQDYEYVAMLLSYGADPFIVCSEGYNSFELAVVTGHSFLVQEILFEYSYDEHDEVKIHLDVLLQLAKVKSSFFQRLFEYRVKTLVQLSDEYLSNLFNNLLVIDLEPLEILLERCHQAICQSISACNTRQNFREIDFNENLLKSNEMLTKLDLLIHHSDILNLHLLNFIGGLKDFVLPDLIISRNRSTESTATEILIYLIQHGLKWHVSLYQTVYTAYGYCDLFKFLLRVEPEVTCDHYPKNAMIALIHDVTFDFEDFLKKPDDYSEINSAEHLLDYFADSRLSLVLWNFAEKWNLSGATLARIEKHPKVALLVDLARNAVRRHLIRRFGVRNTKEFYSVVDALPTTSTHKKIISFESKLY